MRSGLYPIRFIPSFRERIWGGHRMHGLLGKTVDPSMRCGESWEICGLPGQESVVQNGFLASNNLQELSEIYMGELLGEQVFEKHGDAFPLLLKFIDTGEALSVQVHPNDALAGKRHRSGGKTEMWVVLHADPGATIINGFKEGVDKDVYLRCIENNRLHDILHVESVQSGDVYYIPAGRVHAIGAGITLCEIQQSSDITYRLYDWDRLGLDGEPRTLHQQEALDAIDFSPVRDRKISDTIKKNTTSELVSCPFFTTRLHSFDRKISCDYFYLDSFVVFVCLEGSFVLRHSVGSEEELVKRGDVLLLPAEIKNVELLPRGDCRVLETYIA